MWLKKLNAMMWLNFFPSLGEISPSFAIFLFLTNFQGLTATSGYFFEDFAYLWRGRYYVYVSSMNIRLWVYVTPSNQVHLVDLWS